MATRKLKHGDDEMNMQPVNVSAQFNAALQGAPKQIPFRHTPMFDPGVYRVVVPDSKMSPCLELGDTLYINPTMTAHIDDRVLVTCRHSRRAGRSKTVLGMLVSRSDASVILYQFNPPREIVIPAKHVLSVHRIVAFDIAD